MKFSETLNKMERNDNSDRFFTSKENSIITQLFYSQIINIYYCSYNYISYSFQKIMDIPLLLPDNVIPASTFVTVPISSVIVNAKVVLTV